MRFKVSTNIKSIIGKDLINDKYIAIFELVKNSCDAGADKILIEFINDNESSKIVISDNGCGMTIDELQNKWLFIAYSEKKQAAFKNKRMAGSKGIGRFSCDRLGHELTLYTKKDIVNSPCEVLKINWDLFEKNNMQKVEEIDLQQYTISKLPNNNIKGTILEISNLRESWPREDLLRLKASLMKLVSPEKAESNKIEIEIKADHEKEADSHEKGATKTGLVDRSSGKLQVNGVIVNDIFEKLGIKTTSIKVVVSEKGETIETIIEDRGEFVFRIVRKNDTYDKLENINIKVFYLNRSAKLNFTRTMGTEPLNYGSIFMYKNGFRIYPYGTPGMDFLNINERKAQGYNRFLGTRDLMGHIEIIGDNENFIEKTSRDGGFIENFTTKQLEDFFVAEVLRTLEKYVVDGIEWGDPQKGSFIEGRNEQGLMPLDVSDKIVKQFANLTKRGEIISADINPDILSKVEPIRDEIQKSIKGLEKIAEATQSSEIYNLIDKIKEEAEHLKKQKEEAQRSFDVISEELRKTEIELKIREKQTATLQRQKRIDSIQYEDALHAIYAVSDPCVKALTTVYRYLKETRQEKEITEKTANALGTVKRIFKVSDLALNYDYGISIKKPKDIVSFVKQYIKDFWADKTNVFVTTNKFYKLICNFDVSKVSIIIDNILSNSKKHKAKNVEIVIEQKGNMVSLLFIDDGTGLDSGINNPESIFERGFSSTSGLGLGLYHVKRIAKDLSGDVHIEKNVKQGFALEVLIKYEYQF